MLDPVADMAPVGDVMYDDPKSSDSSRRVVSDGVENLNFQCGRVNVKSWSGHYLCCDLGRDRLVTADREVPRPWETFSLERHPEGDFALKTFDGRWVAVEADGRLRGDRSSAQEWERFEVVDQGLRHVALRTRFGYVCAEGGGGGALIANRPEAREWEYFEIIAADIFGTYRLYERLGEGYFGQTFRALNTVEDETVALKIFKNSGSVTQIRADALPLMKLKHPNIVGYLDCNVIDGKGYVATEYCDGGELTSKLGKVDEREADRLARELFDGIRAIHAGNYIHRDLKPGNIFLNRGRLKIGDFGIAIKSEHTAPQEVIGTRAYMAPEQLRGQLSPKSDVWAAGVIVCELFAGSRPTAGRDARELPRGWSRVIPRCLGVDHVARPAAAEVCRQLGI